MAVFLIAQGLWMRHTLRKSYAAEPETRRAIPPFPWGLVSTVVAGFVGVAVPGVEPMVAASLLVLGLLLAQRRQLPLALTTALVGGFAFFHGAAHGSELGGAGQWLALAGMLVSTALLHGTGMALGHAVVARHRWLAVLAGASTALLGAALLVRMA